MERQTEADAGDVVVVRFTRARFVNEFGMAWEEADGRTDGKLGIALDFGSGKNESSLMARAQSMMEPSTCQSGLQSLNINLANYKYRPPRL